MFRWLRRLFGKGDDDIVALVLLLSTPRFLDRTPVLSAIERATGRRLGADELREEAASYYRLSLDGFELTLCSAPQPYIPDPEKFSEQFQELRLRDAVARHTGCILIDVWKAPPGMKREDAIPTMGKILAEFFDDTALSVYSRVSHRHNVVDEELGRLFQEGKADEAMATMTFGGISQADAEDPKMVAAIAEARRRWPEFVAAWQSTEDRGTFIVKAPFTDGVHTEHMWVTPTQIEESQITGILMNQPFQLPRPREGDEVTFATEGLTDWMMVQDDEVVGAFTEALVRRSQR